MIHQRRQIRQAIVRALIDANTAARHNVHDHPWNERTVFPALVVEDAGESQQVISLSMGGDSVIERQYVVQVSAELQPVDNWARERDDLMAEVEVAVLRDAAALLPFARSIAPVVYQPDDALGAARPTYIGRQRFAITYHTTAANPGGVA